MLTRLINAPLTLQRIVAIALAGSMALVALAASTAVVGGVWADRAELIALRVRAGHLTQIASMKHSLGDRFEPEQTGDQAILFIEAPSDSIARAALQERVSTIVRNSGSALGSIGNAPDENETGITMIGLKADLSGSHDAVHKTVLALETSLPPLIVREATIRLVSGSATGTPPELSAQLRVYGAYRQSQPDNASRAEQEAGR